jgi:hypothetical protein
VVTYGCRLPLTKVSLKIHRYRIECDGALFNGCGRHNPPLATFLVRRASPASSFRISKKQIMGNPAIDRYREAQQIIAQLLLSRAEQPRRDEYRAAVVCLHGTILQLVTASVPRRYLEVLISGKRPRQCLQICRSTQYDLLDCEGRKGALAHLWIVLDFIIPRPEKPGEDVR